MKIYTKTGDSGETGLFGGQRVSKDHPRVRAYGEVDELNAVLGMARVHTAELVTLDEELARLQGELFSVGADLATPPRKGEKTPRIGEAHIEALEASIDRTEAELPALTRFVLPGGSPAGAVLHLARTVCRRAERRVVELMEHSGEEGSFEKVLIYLNRLSDLLFVLARHANHSASEGHAEIYWDPPPLPDA